VRYLSCFESCWINSDIGPDLDSLKPSEEQVKGVVTEGLGVMPAFGEEDLLTSEEIDAVSYYVANSSGK